MNHIFFIFFDEKQISPLMRFLPSLYGKGEIFIRLYIFFVYNQKNIIFARKI